MPALCSPSPSWPPSAAIAADTAKIVLIAGNPSHGPGDHEFNAGIMLLAKCLKEMPSTASTPSSSRAAGPRTSPCSSDAKTVVFFMDGGGGHPMIQKPDRLKTMQKIDGSGRGAWPASTTPSRSPRAKPGDKPSSNGPGWILRVRLFNQPPLEGRRQVELPKHPITRGVKPFAVQVTSGTSTSASAPTMKSVTPIVVAKPDDKPPARERVRLPPRPHAQHIVEAKGRDEVLAWAVERPDGGRGFGFTGGHAHKNWGDENFRKLVLNAIVWTAKLDVPENGIACSVSDDELKANLDPKGK